MTNSFNFFYFIKKKLKKKARFVCFLCNLKGSCEENCEMIQSASTQHTQTNVQWAALTLNPKCSLLWVWKGYWFGFLRDTQYFEYEKVIDLGFWEIPNKEKTMKRFEKSH